MDFLNSFPPVAPSTQPPYLIPVIMTAVTSTIVAVASAIFISFASLASAGTASITLPLAVCALFATTAFVSIIALYLLLRKKPQLPMTPVSTSPSSLSNFSPTAKSPTSSETEKALSLSKLTLSANNGEPEAMYTLGMHLLKESDDKDVESALKWLELADEKNYAGVKLFLSNYYFDKTTDYLDRSGALADEEEIAKLYMQAASKGHAVAQYEYALCCLQGKGTVLDEETAIKWLKKSAKQTYMLAVLRLGLCFASKEAHEDKLKGINLIKKAAESKLAEAEYYYGMSLKQKIVAEPDHVAGLEWIKKAANQDLLGAIIQLALCFHKGEGCTKNHPEALKLFKRAAIQNPQQAEAYIHAYFPNEGL